MHYISHQSTSTALVHCHPVLPLRSNAQEPRGQVRAGQLIYRQEGGGEGDAQLGLLCPARGQIWGLVGLLHVPRQAQFTLDKTQEVAEKEKSC